MRLRILRSLNSRRPLRAALCGARMGRDHSGKRFQQLEGGIETMTRTRWSLLGVLLVAVVFACGYATLATADRVSHPISAVTNVVSGSDGLTAVSNDPRICANGGTASTDGLP